MDATDIVRFSIAALATVAFVWLLIDLKGRAKFLTPRRKNLTYSLIAFMFAVVFGSIEQIMQNGDPGWRMVITPAAVIWTLAGLYFGRHDDMDDITLADAWHEGMRTGTSRAMRHMSDEPNLPLASDADNPYRLYDPPNG